jgi:type VI secretion system protein ImpK
VSAIYWASAEVLMASVRIGVDRDLPAPSELRDRFTKALQQMVAQCRASGVPEVDIGEAHYALVAFIDERVLKSNWPGRTEWMNSPLQLLIYREFRAGEHFYTRMGALLQQTAKSTALEVYYLCLALGFTGAQGMQEARSYQDAARGRIASGVPGSSLSPHAVPNDHFELTRTRRPFALAVAAGCIVIVGLGLALLSWSLGSAIASAGADLGTAGVVQRTGR